MSYSVTTKVASLNVVKMDSGHSILSITPIDCPPDKAGRMSIGMGSAKVRMLLELVRTSPQTLIGAMEHFLGENAAAPAPAPVAAAPAPIPIPIPAPAPAPIVATIPAGPAPAPVKPPKDEPVKTATYNGKTYGQFADGSTRQRDTMGRWRVRTGLAIKWDAMTTPAPKLATPAPSPVKPTAPTPTPTPTDKSVLREVCDGDTLIILYVDGTYKLVNMAVNA